VKLAAKIILVVAALPIILSAAAILGILAGILIATIQGGPAK
jgi:hypothetical protein